MKQHTKILFFILVFTLQNCDIGKIKFQETAFTNDIVEMELEYVIANKETNEFIASFLKDNGVGSGIRILKLYNTDSISIDDCYFGAHPLKVTDWNNDLIMIDCGATSGIGELEYRTWYLDNSVDKNKKLGTYKILYNKDYNYKWQ